MREPSTDPLVIPTTTPTGPDLVNALNELSMKVPPEFRPCRCF
jgi:hypothetical protein